MSASRAIDGVRTLLASARAGDDPAPALDAIAERLDEPLRLAIAGRVKAGKSTLLNALVGQALAPTDAGESTRIVTWYRDGPTYRATLYPRQGPPRQAPFRAGGVGADVDLGTLGAEDVERLVVEWPSAALRETTLIDTPGLASVSGVAATTTLPFLTPEDGDAQADAVLYLLRHVHPADLQFLEAFHQERSAISPANAVGVLSRADEVAGGRADAIDVARRTAERYQQDPRLRRLCGVVVPVAGLLAEGAATMQESEFEALAHLAKLPAEATDELLLSVDRFGASDAPAEPGRASRAALLSRLGIFGVRRSIGLIRAGVSSSVDLAAQLAEDSGINELRRVLASAIAARAGTLKARSALAALEGIALASSANGSEDLLREVERLQSGAHEFVEIELLGALRAGAITLPGDRGPEAERLLGAAGGSAAGRLGLPEDAPADRVRVAAVEAVARWRELGESPLASPQVAEVARSVVRTCEGLVAELA